jgi:hypothetical protein
VITAKTTSGKQAFLNNFLTKSSCVSVRIAPTLNLAYQSYCKQMEPNKAIIRITQNTKQLHLVKKKCKIGIV